MHSHFYSSQFFRDNERNNCRSRESKRNQFVISGWQWKKRYECMSTSGFRCTCAYLNTDTRHSNGEALVPNQTLSYLSRIQIFFSSSILDSSPALICPKLSCKQPDLALCLQTPAKNAGSSLLARTCCELCDIAKGVILIKQKRQKN